ncbi:MAG: Gfo/Idh/MocA family oxidoreductase [Roseitalea sp.]|nr:Gfo/Idh/MocA family oxidoreductase [Roseitalea sp.]MBO6720207.1 Gfo/Idh/MocA family oxidoreductase [Roseitalea sp.]MBO6742567.1 Gfo/Idh/MocA family oxidoreductase [Roseitalea sp.]
MPRVAILGAGIGAQHMDGYLALPDHWQVAVVCDLDADKAEAVAAQAPGSTVTADLDEVLADRDIDVIDICLPPHLHAPVAIAALEAGKHVICEKPLAGSVRDADRMAAAADKAGRMLVPVFQYRYGRGLYQLAELERRGLTGNPLVATLETHWNRGADYYAVPWRGRWYSEGGGAVLGHAIHAHDLVSRFVGPVSEVTAMVDTRVNPIETEDCAALAMRCETGALVTSSVTLGGARDTSRLRFVFERVTAESGRNPYAPGADDWTFEARTPLDQSALDDALAEAGVSIDARPVGYAGQFVAIADHLDGKPAGLVTAGEGVRSIEFVAAVYKSARAGQTVRLPLDRADPICTDWTPQPPKGD